MNTKIIIAATVAALSLATTAFAGEGGRPEPFTGTLGQANSSSFVADTGSQQYPTPNPAFSFQPLGEPTLPENGQNGPVQTADSLPRGFENGTVAFTQAQSVERWYAQQADHRFTQLHRASSPHG
jgi:hypothetical protein